MIGLISLCNAFWMIIYLYGLSATSSAAFNSALYIFPIILIAIAIVSFVLKGKKKNSVN